MVLAITELSAEKYLVKLMKLLLENWRRQCGEYDFDILCENFDRGLITEIELYETWDRQVMVEMQTLLDEGIMDILKIGYEKGKVLVGKAKKTYDAAIAKVTEFYLKLCLQAWGLIQKGKVVLERIAAILMKGVNFIKKFCNVHPILCKIALTVIIIIVISAVMASFPSEALADVDVSGVAGKDPGTMLTSEETDGLIGVLEKTLSAALEGDDRKTAQSATDAMKWLVKAADSEQIESLAETSDLGTQLLRQEYELLVHINDNYPEIGKELVELGKSVTIRVRTN